VIVAVVVDTFGIVGDTQALVEQEYTQLLLMVLMLVSAQFALLR
jgi:hypothetical protein